MRVLLVEALKTQLALKKLTLIIQKQMQYQMRLVAKNNLSKHRVTNHVTRMQDYAKFALVEKYGSCLCHVDIYWHVRSVQKI